MYELECKTLFIRISKTKTWEKQNSCVNCGDSFDTNRSSKYDYIVDQVSFDPLDSLEDSFIVTTMYSHVLDELEKSISCKNLLFESEEIRNHSCKDCQ